jgi:hypothetical protein
MPPSQKKRKQAVTRSRSFEPVLITESSRKLAALRKALSDEIQPNGAIERGLVDDLAAVMWDIVRLIRFKIAILNGAFLEALTNILKQLFPHETFENRLAHEHAAEALARRWLANDTDARAEVFELLGNFQLDETAIEAEAFRLRAQELAKLDYMVSLAEVRREKVLTGIAAFRDALGRRVRQVSDQMLEQESVPQLVAIAKRGS